MNGLFVLGGRQQVLSNETARQLPRATGRYPMCFSVIVDDMIYLKNKYGDKFTRTASSLNNIEITCKKMLAHVYDIAEFY